MYPQEETDSTLIIEKSRFICYLKQTKSEEEYREYLAAIRKKHHDATHVCSAFISGNIRRSSDDGEPAGTAGVPILNVLSKNGLDETCALVVRYFGGIKLGTGGLIRAYGNAVSECLKKAVLLEDIAYPQYQITLDYESANRLQRYLRDQALNLHCEYGEDVTCTFALDDPDKLTKIAEITKGKQAQLSGEEIIQKVVQ